MSAPSATLPKRTSAVEAVRASDRTTNARAARAKMRPTSPSDALSACFANSTRLREHRYIDQV